MQTAELLRKVRRLEIRSRHLVADLFAGNAESVFKGRGIEFDEVRRYVPGDEVRSIDWNVTARFGEPFVKRFAEERELTVMLVVDVSRSMRFGTTGAEKRELAAELCAVLAFAANVLPVSLLAAIGMSLAYIPVTMTGMGGALILHLEGCAGSERLHQSLLDEMAGAHRALMPRPAGCRGA